MKRKIISINESLCNGCGLCISACHEGALQLVEGKARLISDSYCDGLGDCLPECPTGAIEIIEREADAYDESAVQTREAAQKSAETHPTLACGCPGTMARTIDRPPSPATPATSADEVLSELTTWPVQIKLVNPKAPYLQNASLLIAADCTAFAFGDIHRKFMRNKVTLIGCPKLDEGDYAEKLAEILRQNEIRNLTILRMEVPCCGGLATAVQRALQASGKMIPWQVITISTDGRILDE